MKKRIIALIALTVALLTCFMNSCAFGNGGQRSAGTSGDAASDGENTGSGTTGTTIPDADTVDVDKTKYNYVFESSEGGSYTYRDAESGKTATLTVTFVSGTEGAFTVNDNTLTFSGLAVDSVYALSGEFYGNIVVNGNEEYKLELELNGFSLTSYTECPLLLTGCDKVTLSAKKGSGNYVIDLRDATENYTGCVYADCDLDIQGKGTLYVVSENNNGIHTKDDLTVKNLVLQVECEDNALKGNDGVTVESGELTLIARSGDGIKTSNSGLSKKGKQKGNIVISGGTLSVFAACDGLDAACDVLIDESSATVSLSVATGKYSKYTATSATSDPTATSAAADAAAAGAPEPPSGGFGGGFGGGGRPGGNMGGNGGGPGDMGGGNTEKSSVSAKGIKAANAVVISAGTINITAHDDAIHANNDTALESGAAASGNVTVSGGSLTLFSADDAIHADAKATVTGGTVNITGCYEGIEGAFVEIGGGNITVISRDDGLNGTSTTGESIVISGGTLYVLAGGDGVDSNSKTSGDGILFSGGNAVIISTGNADSSIDTENGYKYTGGNIIGIGKSGGMSRESAECSPSLNSVGTSANVNLQSGAVLYVEGMASVKMPVALNAFVVVLGKAGASVSSSASSSAEFDANGVAWG